MFDYVVLPRNCVLSCVPHGESTESETVVTGVQKKALPPMVELKKQEWQQSAQRGIHHWWKPKNTERG